MAKTYVLATAVDQKDLFEDDFNRANEKPMSTNGWTSAALGASGGGNGEYMSLYTSGVFWYASNDYNINTIMYRDNEKYNRAKLPLEMSLTVHAGISAAVGSTGFYMGSSTNGSRPTDATGVGIRVAGTASIFTISAGEQISAQQVTLASATTYNLKAQWYPSMVRARLWEEGDTEPATWDISQPTVFQGVGDYFVAQSEVSAPAAQYQTYTIDDLDIKTGDPE